MWAGLDIDLLIVFAIKDGRLSVPIWLVVGCDRVSCGL